MSSLPRPPLDGANANANAETGAEADAELHWRRRSIDNLDAALIHLLAERFRHVVEIGRLKARRQLQAADPDREARMKARYRAMAESAGLDPGVALRVIEAIIAEGVASHRRIRAGSADAGSHSEPNSSNQ